MQVNFGGAARSRRVTREPRAYPSQAFSRGQRSFDAALHRASEWPCHAFARISPRLQCVRDDGPQSCLRTVSFFAVAVAASEVQSDGPMTCSRRDPHRFASNVQAARIEGSR